MTIPVSGDTDITRADATGTFKTQITDVVNAINKWRSESNTAGNNRYLVIQTPSQSFTPVVGSQTVTVASDILSIISITARVFHDDTSTQYDLAATGISFTGNQVTFTLTPSFPFPPDYFMPEPHTIRYRRVNDSTTAGTPTLSSTTPAPLTGALLAGNTVTGSPVAADVALGDISLSALATLLENTARVLSRARQVRLIKQYTSTLGGYAPLCTGYDVTNTAHLTSTYQLASTGVASPAAGNIDASAFNTFVDNLETAVTNHRNTVLTFTETWCHSSCHSNHSSRGRR